MLSNMHYTYKFATVLNFRTHTSELCSELMGKGSQAVPEHAGSNGLRLQYLMGLVSFGVL